MKEDICKGNGCPLRAHCLHHQDYLDWKVKQHPRFAPFIESAYFNGKCEIYQTENAKAV